VPSARMIGVGAFVIGGVLLFAIALFMIGERQMLFTKQFEVYTEFARLSGLQQGAPVQVSGMGAGEVKDIRIPTSPAGKFRVRLQIRSDLHPLVRTDSICSIRTEGLVGGQYVLVTAGSERAPEAPDGSTIPSREPFDIADLLDQASLAVRQVNDTIAGVRAEIETAITNITLTVEDANKLIHDVGVDVRSITAAGAKVANDVSAITEGVREGRGTVGQLVVNDDLYRRVDAMTSDTQQATANIREATESARRLIDQWSTKGGPGEGLTNELRDTLNRANQTLTNLAENTEALKHNWFFSGYFKRRGYYSLNEISPEEYRSGVIEKAGDRARLGVWLAASVLFATHPDGHVSLLDGAKPRLDSAMGTFVRYLGSSPIVVEGYAEAGSNAQRYLESRQRASVVRAYLLDRFALNPDRVGVMPLGSQATDSPTGNTWDGVAIAVFVPRDAIQQPKQKK
jgi:phospholipid/cholesterol/gamma-HCH transport system substrate-binding protein